MKLVKGQVYLFDVKTKEDVLKVKHFCNEAKCTALTQLTTSDKQIDLYIINNLLVDEAFDLLHNPCNTSLEEGIWVDISKIPDIPEEPLKEYTMEQLTDLVGHGFKIVKEKSNNNE